MKLENQCVSLRIAKRLKELGVPQDSLFSWRAKNTYKKDYKDFDKMWFADVEFGRNMTDTETNYKVASAFTVAELGEMLPTVIESMNPNTNKKSFYYLHFWIFGKKEGVYLEYSCGHCHSGKFKNWNNQDVQHCRCFVEASTEADARAKMLIYLIENNLIK